MGNDVSQPLDDHRATDFVIVPDVVGLPFLEAREIAFVAGVSIANPNPDGAPVAAIVWPNNPTIQRQLPAPGTVVYRWDSLAVWLPSDFESDMAHTLGTRPPFTDRAHTVPEVPIEVTDLTNDGSSD
ncbi:MAG: PASTA domain-containing protein [Leifsonia sp.]